MIFTRRIFSASHICDFLVGNNVLKLDRAIFSQKPILGFFIRRRNFIINHRSNSNNLVIERSINVKKRLVKKKKLQCEKSGFRIIALSTAEEYNLENLSIALSKYTAFESVMLGTQFGSSVDAVHAVRTFDNQTECQDLFFFREGSVVMWNVTDSEVNNILCFLKKYEESSFIDELILDESESLSYIYSDVPKTSIAKDSLVISLSSDILLEKYTISNAMALSVHLGAYEASLEQYINTMEPVTEDLKAGVKIKMSRSEVLRKTGQLFALRHNINLSSDLLDTPDFYWDREELERLYQKMFNYFCINRRTKVINEKINHCIELVELLSSHLNDKHHVRLEWMIIILIMVEVGFEILHYLDKFLDAGVK